MGVDLNQPRAVHRQVKVQPKASTRRPWLMGRDVGGPLQDVLAISRICCDVEDRRRDSPHGVQRCAINGQGIRGKQVGVHGWIRRELRKGGSEEPTTELQSLLRSAYAVLRLKPKPSSPLTTHDIRNK